MPRRMSDPAFLADQRAHLHDAHIKPITRYVDRLRATGEWLPYVAPLHGGVNARMLSVLRDPGPKTRDEVGSGMLCIENNDQSAEIQFGLMAGAGLTPVDFIPWNAYPWYINAKPTRQQISRASPTLTGLIDLLPELRVILLQGNDAMNAWRVALEAQPDLRRRKFAVVETYHPSAQALRSSDPQERARRIQHRIDAWKTVADTLEAD